MKQSSVLLFLLLVVAIKKSEATIKVNFTHDEFNQYVASVAGQEFLADERGTKVFGKHPPGQKSSDVKVIDCGNKGNNFERYPSMLSSIFGEAEVLLLQNSGLQKLTSESFIHSKKVKIMMFAGDNFSIEPAVFRECINLEVLKFDDMDLSNVNVEAFEGIANLKILSIKNCQITRIEPELLEPLENLMELHITENPMKIPPISAIQRMTHLRVLNLSGNKLTHLHDDLFKHKDFLEFVDVSKNVIHEVERDILLHWPAHATINMEGNTCVDKKFDHIGTDSLTLSDVANALMPCFNDKNGFVVDEEKSNEDSSDFVEDSIEKSSSVSKEDERKSSESPETKESKSSESSSKEKRSKILKKLVEKESHEKSSNESKENDRKSSESKETKESKSSEASSKKKKSKILQSLVKKKASKSEEKKIQEKENKSSESDEIKPKQNSSSESSEGQVKPIKFNESKLSEAKDKRNKKSSEEKISVEGKSSVEKSTSEEEFFKSSENKSENSKKHELNDLSEEKLKDVEVVATISPFEFFEQEELPENIYIDLPTLKPESEELEEVDYNKSKKKNNKVKKGKKTTTEGPASIEKIIDLPEPASNFLHPYEQAWCRLFIDANNEYNCVLENITSEVKVIKVDHLNGYDDSKVAGLFLRHSVLVRIPSIFFDTFENLRHLSVENTNIKQLDEDTVKDGCGRLKTISLKNNKIRRLERHALSKCENLEDIDLTGNPIEYIEGDIFNYNPKLSITIGSLKMIAPALTSF